MEPLPKMLARANPVGPAGLPTRSTDLWRPAGAVCNVHRAPMLARTTRNPKLVRTASLLGAVLLTTFSASGIRLTDQHVREATRGVAVANGATRLKRSRRPRATSRSSAGAPVAPKLSHRWVHVWAWPFPLLARVVALVGRPHGVDAGSGAPRRRRWASLGGHGRHGAG